MSKNKILFFYPSASSFILKDRELIAKHYEVKEFLFRPKNKYLTPLLFLEQFFFLLRHIFSADLIFCEFSGYLAVLPVLFAKLFRRPSIIVLCGSDCHSFPSIEHGAYRKKLLGVFTGWAIKNATLVTPVHISLRHSDYTYTDSDYPRQGYLEFNPDAEVACMEINYGYDTKDFHITGEQRKKNSFLTVAINLEKPFFYRKGIDLLLAAAAMLPGCSFTIIGRSPSIEKLELPQNVTIIPPVPYTQLIHYYNRHEFYLQLSMAEGFPNALCEAMLCGCVPIGSNVFGIPDIIGDTGYILPRKDKDQLVALIRTAIAKDNIQELSQRASQRILQHFSIETRERKFVEAIEGLLQQYKR